MSSQPPTSGADKTGGKGVPPVIPPKAKKGPASIIKNAMGARTTLNPTGNVVPAPVPQPGSSGHAGNRPVPVPPPAAGSSGSGGSGNTGGSLHPVKKDKATSGTAKFKLAKGKNQPADVPAAKSATTANGGGPRKAGPASKPGAGTKAGSNASGAKTTAKGSGGKGGASGANATAARKVTTGVAATSVMAKANGKNVTSGANTTGGVPRVSATTNTTGGNEKIDTGPRKVKLTLSRVSPLSAMKMGFLLSVAAGIALIVVVFVLYSTLDAMGVFYTIEDLIKKVVGSEGSSIATSFVENFERSQVMSFAALGAVILVVVSTILSAIGALIYNLLAIMVGGVRMTFTDE
jgi:hypothetical protein